MLAEFGFFVFVMTFLLALYGIGAALFGVVNQDKRWVSNARRAMQLTFPLVTLGAVILICLLLTGHFEIQYVYSVTSSVMPTYLKVTALWGGQAGSLVLWSWLLSFFAFLVALRNWERESELLPWVVVVILVTLAFFLSLTIFFENPFVRWWLTPMGPAAAMFRPEGAVTVTPPDGLGLNPLLRHPGMIAHPPMLYLGFVAFVIPYAYTMAALITGANDERWIRLVHRWALWAWLFLSIGLVLGMRWAYDVLGWGGYWAWDPVENAALMPWLIGTPFLHTFVIQEKRGVFKQLNMLLIILMFIMVIIGTFMTRSGVFSSVHAFAQSAIGPAFFFFITVILIASIALLISRWNIYKTEKPLGNIYSREALIIIAVFLFLSIFVIVLWGVLFPIISELIINQKITVGPPYYQRATTPLLGMLLFLMGISLLSPWTRSTFKTICRAIWIPLIPTLLVLTILIIASVRNIIALIGFSLIAFVIFTTLYEVWRGGLSYQRTSGKGFLAALWDLAKRNRRRYGGYLVHIAMAMMAAGILGMELFQTTTQRSLSVGQEIQIGGYSLRFESLAQFPYIDGRMITRAELSVFKNGRYLGKLYPRSDLYPSGQPMTIPSIYSTLANDLYVVLVSWEEISALEAPFRVYYNPLVNWLWIGSLVFIAGMLVVAWPECRKN